MRDDGAARSGVGAQPAANEDGELALMGRIDELFLLHPCLGSRRMGQILPRCSAVTEPLGAWGPIEHGFAGHAETFRWAGSRFKGRVAPARSVFVPPDDAASTC